MFRRLLVLTMLALTFAPSSRACELPTFADNGRYVGGDLAAQLARKADTIQIVRATARHLYRRTYSEGARYLQSGNDQAPSNQPEFVAEYVYELSVVEALKGPTQSVSEYYEAHPRILAYDAAEWRARWGDGADSDRHRAINALPDWLLDRPGDSGMPFTGGVEEGASLGLGMCRGPYVIEVGQTFIAFRDSVGRLYPSGMAASSLTIEAEFRTQSGRRARVPFNMQALVPIADRDDPFVMRLLRALQTH